MARETLRWSLVIDERDAVRKGDLREYFRYWLHAEARARKLRLLNIDDYRLDREARDRLIRLDASVTVEPLPTKEEREQEKQRARDELKAKMKAKMEYMRTRYEEEGKERDLAGRMAEIEARYQETQRQLEADRRRVAMQEEVERRYYIDRTVDEIAGPPRRKTPPKAVKAAPEKPPAPAVRRLDLDEAAPVALPAQKGRVLDLE